MSKPDHRVSASLRDTALLPSAGRRKLAGRKSPRRVSETFLKKKHFLYGLIVAAVMTAIVAYLWGMSYLRSEAFRLSVIQQVSDLLGVDGNFSELKWQSSSVETDFFHAKAKSCGNQTVETIEANQLSVSLDWRSVWEDTFEMSQLQIHSLKIHLSKNQGKKKQDKEREVIQNIDKKGSKIHSATWYQRFLPKAVTLSDAKINSLNVDYTAADGKEFSIENSQVDVSFSNREVSVEMQGGLLGVEGEFIDEVVLHTAKWNYRENDLQLQSLRASVCDGAKLDLSGKIAEWGQSYALNGTLIGVQCSHFLPDSWLSRLEGEMAARFYAERGSARASANTEVKGELKVRNGVLRGLPMLDQMAAYSETRGFQTLRFSKFQCEFQSSEDQLEIRNMFLHCDGLMRIEGDLSIQNRRFDGQLQLGVVPGVLRHIPGTEQKIFLPGKDQLLWTPVRITGTLEDMKEDLTERMLLAAGMRMFETIPETGLQVLRFTGQGIGDIVLPEGFGVLSELLNTTGLDEVKSNFPTKGSLQSPLDTESLSVPADILEEGQSLLESSLGGLGNLFESRQKEFENKQEND